MAKLIEHTGEDRFFAVLSYIGTLPFMVLPLFIIPLLMKKGDKWIHNHAKQGMVYFLAWVLLVWIPLLGWLWGIYLIIVGIIAIVKICKGEPYWSMPLVGSIVKKI